MQQTWELAAAVCATRELLMPSTSGSARLLDRRPQDERHPQVHAAGGIEAQEGLERLAGPAGIVARTTGHDAPDRPLAFDAFGREHFLPLPAEHEELRAAHPPRRVRNLRSGNEVRTAADPYADVTGAV